MTTTIFDNQGSPWAGIGKSVHGAVNVQDAMVRGGLDWDVKKEPLFLADGTEVDARAVVREDTNAVLGTVSKKWTPYQNSEAFQWFEPFVEANELSFSTVGCCRGGRITWIMAQLNRPNSVVAQGDEVAKYLLMSNSHDGTRAVRVGFTPIRVVCANTLHASHKAAGSRLLRVNHSQHVKQNVDSIREIISVANQDFEATATQYRFLASRQIKSSDLKKYCKIVLGKETVADDELSTRTKNQIEAITRLFDEGRGNDNPYIAGSWWAAYNGVTEWLSYERGNNADNRMASLWFGQNKNVNQLAFEQAVELATAA